MIPSVDAARPSDRHRHLPLHGRRGLDQAARGVGDEAYEEALSVHRRIVRAACQAHDGVEVDTQGDAFFFAFPEASGALAAAQQMTEGSRRADPGPCRPAHGDAAPRRGGLRRQGRALRCPGRRICARRPDRALAGDPRISRRPRLTDLGEHRLKDIERRGRRSSSSATRASRRSRRSRTRTSRARRAPSSAGRRARRRPRQDRGRSRLVTLTGPGGSARRGSRSRPLPRSSPSTRRASSGSGSPPCATPRSSRRRSRQTLGRQGRPRRAHRRAGAAAPPRQPGAGDRGGARALGPPPGLPQPDPARHEPRAPARAGRGRVPGATARRARGRLPLLRALAARAERGDRRALCAPRQPPARGRARRRPHEGALARQILERLSQRLDLLKGGRDADPRQQTLRATIEWSYDLLSEEEQRLFARLSVFAGGCTLEAAEEVCDADLDTLQSLVEKSLLRFTNERYWMLETIREYACERLAGSGEREPLERVHAVRHARIAVELSVSSRGRSAETLQVLREEQENMRAALEFALQRDEVAIASDLIHGLWFYWLTTGSGREAAGWAHRYLASSRKRLSPLERFAGDHGAVAILRFAGDAETAMRLKRELVAIGRVTRKRSSTGWSWRDRLLRR